MTVLVADSSLEPGAVSASGSLDRSVQGLRRLSRWSWGLSDW